MIPFLLDDVAQLHYQDMLRESEANLLKAQVVKEPNSRSLYRRMRMGSGRLFIAVGSFLAQSSAAASTVRLDRVS